jgi:hypothetical protein
VNEKVKEKKYLDNYEIAQPDKYFVPFEWSVC